MQVKEMMTANRVSCTSDMSLPDIARLMVVKDCGEIPVVEDPVSRLPIGVVTECTIWS
jgi:predicted transcriptional regulator